MRFVFLLSALALFSASIAKSEGGCYVRCDFDGNGYSTTVTDYGKFFSAFGSRQGDPNFIPEADFDGNGVVTVADFGKMQQLCPLVK